MRNRRIIIIMMSSLDVVTSHIKENEEEKVDLKELSNKVELEKERLEIAINFLKDVGAINITDKSKKKILLSEFGKELIRLPTEN
ncbi:MAG: hypothetical protein BTN85_1741 [Candidatus Methanohalarchaeum thermophilum]|uniref:Uncharacterized protein n=1 Tax=Methanohalarchaeum thermophilum TaxID=1903181 RepID=A0A1Q6DXZ7_METT1|nr:MAG: hypothetical protein BTN85_1741 [Candidatus Methanohalarchaeum thermophilum]